MNKIKTCSILAISCILILLYALSASANLSPYVTDTGFISLSIDGLGTGGTGNIQVDKPAGATVRSAYFFAASTWAYNTPISDGQIILNGTGVNWDSQASLFTVYMGATVYNHAADVTSIVKSTIDAAASGIIDISVTETNAVSIDGSILAVIFDDPNQTVTNTVVLLFGAQQNAGDTFNIGLGSPIDLTDPNLVLDFSLGIAFSYRPSSQYSVVEVNGSRLTTDAGGQDDGGVGQGNGWLITAGGVGDSNNNPIDPNNYNASTPLMDDELYSLLPFVNNGDNSISVYTANPSNDDDILFAALFLGSATAVVNEGIILTPATAENPVGTSHTVFAKLQDDTGAPIVGRNVAFSIISGPTAAITATYATNSDGIAQFTYTGESAGTDTIKACFINNAQVEVCSNPAYKTWVEDGSVCGDGVVNDDEECEEDDDCVNNEVCKRCLCMPLTFAEEIIFTATPGNGKVTLTWTAVSEKDVLGYNILRMDSPGMPSKKINSKLIQATGSIETTVKYQFTDNNVRNLKTYMYILEEIEKDGDKKMHGSDEVRPGVINAILNQ